MPPRSFGQVHLPANGTLFSLQEALYSTNSVGTVFVTASGG